VGVDHDAYVDIKGISQDDIGGFSAYACEMGEFFHRLGNLPVMLFDQRSSHGSDRLGFVAIKTGGLDVLFQLFGRYVGVIFGGFVFFEEGFGDNVYAIVGALG